MADFLEEKRREIDERLRELAPLIEEYHRLKAAAAALADLSAPPEPRAADAPRARGDANVAQREPRTPRRRERPKRSGTRAREALALVRAHPGITIPQMAEKMGIKHNYLYRVLPGLADDGLVRKHDRGWYPTGVPRVR